MLNNKYRTPEEQAVYLRDLKNWLEQVKDDPAEQMADFFAKRIDIYEDVHLAHWAEEYAHIADYFADGLTDLLDIGCGTGLELDSIFRRFPTVNVTGIDLSKIMLQKLQENYKHHRLTLINADYFAYPFEQHQYDAAMSFETLHHFQAEKKQQIYNKLFAALKPGGYYIECDYMACCEQEEALCLDGYSRKRLACGAPENVFLHIDIPLTWEHQAALLQNAGFQTVERLYQNESTVILKAAKA